MHCTVYVDVYVYADDIELHHSIENHLDYVQIKEDVHSLTRF